MRLVEAAAALRQQSGARAPIGCRVTCQVRRCAIKKGHLHCHSSALAIAQAIGCGTSLASIGHYMSAIRWLGHYISAIGASEYHVRLTSCQTG